MSTREPYAELEPYAEITEEPGWPKYRIAFYPCYGRIITLYRFTRRSAEQWARKQIAKEKRRRELEAQKVTIR